MRAATSLALILAIGGALAGCAVEPPVASVQCTSRFDCADGERCDDGVCAPADPVIIPVDGGVRFESDAGLPDSGMAIADAGMSEPPDAGMLDPPDAGCGRAPITVLELPSRSFCTIGEAIAAAPAMGTVEVPAAVYEESLTIDKALTVRGPGLNGVVLRAVAGQPVLKITGATVFLRWMILEGNGDDGVIVNGRADLQHVTVQNATGTGITVEGAGAHLDANDVYVSRVYCDSPCDVDGWGEGIAFMTGTKGVLFATAIEDTDFMGLYLEGAEVTLDSGSIARCGRTHCANSDEHCLPGVGIYDGAKLTISNNTWVQHSGGSGIDAEGSTLALLASHVESNGMKPLNWVDGIHLDNASSTLLDNVVRDNFGFGLVCYGVAPMSCARNTYELNQQGSTGGVCGGC